MPKFSSNKIKNIINAIEKELEKNYELNDWEKRFIEDISVKLSRNPELTSKQYDVLLNIIGTDWL